MAARSTRTPSYRLHKPSGQAVVTLKGRDIHIGKHGLAQNRTGYDSLRVEWLVSGRRALPLHLAREGEPGADSSITVNEILLAYLRSADGSYVKNGQPTKEPVNIRLALRPLRKLYGDTPARDFGPKRLNLVREGMIAVGLCRSEVNRRTRHIHGLGTVSGL